MMAIVSKPAADLSSRDEVFSEIGLMIEKAANFPDDIDPWSLASIEEGINSVDQEGNVIHRI